MHVTFHRQPTRSTRNLIRALLAAMFVMLLVLAIGAAWGLRAMNQGLRERLAFEQQVIDEGYKLRIATEREAVGVRGYLLAGDRGSSEYWLAARRDSEAAIGALQRATLPPADRRELDALVQLHRRWEAVEERAMALKRQGEAPRAVALLREQAVPLRNDTVTRLDAFVSTQQRTMAALDQQLGERASRISRLLMIASILAVPLMAGIAWMASARLLVPLRDLERAAIRFGEGDYAARARTTSHDELGAVAVAFNAMADRIAEAVQQYRQFQLLVTNLTDYGIYLLDPTGHVMSWNKGAEALKGYREEEILGSHYGRFFRPEDVAAGKPERLLNLAVELGHIEDQGWRVRKDGSEFWADAVITPLHDERGVLRGFAKITRDLTERKRAEEALAEKATALERQGRLLADIVAHVPAAIAYVDRDLIYRWNNPAHCDMAGLPRERIVGHGVAAVFPDVAPMTRATFIRAFDTAELQYVQGLVIPTTRDGRTTERAYDVAYVPVMSNGTVEGVLIVGSDVSGRVAREKAQQQMIDSLRAVDRLKDEFLSVLSHELRTPINAIMGFGSILADEIPGPLTEEQHHYVGKILNGSDVLLALVDDLLDMGRIRAGKLLLDRHEVAFGDLAEHVVASLQVLAEQRQQAIVCDLPSGLPSVWGDEKRTTQVLTNLINNAIKFSPQGGQIVVKARAVGDTLRCEVQDVGVGIAAEDLSRLFKPFTQLDSSYTRRVGGAGLGLSISKALVEAQGGEIGAESEGEGKGATFWFTLPLFVADPA